MKRLRVSFVIPQGTDQAQLSMPIGLNWKHNFPYLYFFADSQRPGDLYLTQ